MQLDRCFDGRKILPEQHGRSRWPRVSENLVRQRVGLRGSARQEVKMVRECFFAAALSLIVTTAAIGMLIRVERISV